MQLTAVRQRSCPACQRTVGARTARWCGSCGAPLRAVSASDEPDAGDPTPTGDVRRRVALVALTVAVVAGLVVVGGPVADRLPGDGTAVEDLEVAAPSSRALDRVARRFQPPPPPLTGPVCLRAAALDCFRWTVDDADLGRSQVQVAGDLLLATDLRTGEVTARRLSDGALAWRISLGTRSAERIVTTDQLLLSMDEDVLTARDLVDGQVRWRSDVLPAGVSFLAAAQRGTAMVLLAFLDAPLPDEDGTPVEPTTTAVGVDADDGRTRWRTEAPGPAGIASDATVAYVDVTGDLVALEADGSERWRVPAVTPGAPGGAWISAGVVTVYGGEDDGGDRSYLLADGRRLGVGGTAIAHDEGRTLLEAWPGQRSDVGGEDVEPGPTYVLLDADGEIRWEVPADPRGCTLGARFDGDVVRVAGCGGAELVLAIDDGQVRRSRPPSQTSDAFVVTFAERLGPYELTPQAPSDASSAYLLSDTRTEVDVARLPPDSVTLARHDAATWTHDLGGLAVIQHRGGLVAVDLPREHARTVPATGSVTSR